MFSIYVFLKLGVQSELDVFHI